MKKLLGIVDLGSIINTKGNNKDKLTVSANPGITPKTSPITTLVLERKKIDQIRL